MSLTSILDYGNKHFLDLRTLLKEQFPTPKFAAGGKMLVEPVGKNYSVIGMAFDYLFRFELERRYRNLVHASGWVAEHGLSHFIRRQPSSPIHKKNKIDLIYDEFEKCKSIHQSYIASDIPDAKAIVDACFFLSRLEAVYRTSGLTIHHVTLSPEDEDDKAELTQLMQCSDWDLFRPKEKIILNPHFGKASNMVGGADADVIIDDVLIEIKVVKEAKITRLIYNQLLGYYLLYLIGGISGHKRVKIKKLGVFFARHNLLWTVDIDTIGDKNSFRMAKELLIKKMQPLEI